jgi:inhibitor of cysteine peptidase
MTETKHFVVGALIFGLVLIVGALIYSLTAINPELPGTEPTIQKVNLNNFKSVNELKSYIEENSEESYYGGLDFFSGSVQAFAESAGAADSGQSGKSASDFSTTNIQVEGVDEADILKNDGKYIYVVSGNNNRLVIIDAFPAENSKIISEIKFENDENQSTTISEIFINGNKLILFGRESERIYIEPVIEEETEDKPASNSEDSGVSATSILPEEPYYPKYRYTNYAFTKIYDISDKENPKLENEIITEGNYHDSRMIGNYVYPIINQNFRTYYDEDIVLPITIINGKSSELSVSEIFYPDTPSVFSHYTKVQAININNGKVNEKAFLTGYNRNLYVSQNNIYLAEQVRLPFQTVYDGRVEVMKETIPEVRNDINKIENSNLEYYEKQQKIERLVNDYFNKLSETDKVLIEGDYHEGLREYELSLSKIIERTLIHKISIDKSDINYESSGEVPGVTLNQFSMDEFKGDLRIATTTRTQFSRAGEIQSLNHLYVLNDNLEIIGKVEDLAKGERIFSVRFMGERAYMVTFRQVDPLFVLDLENPENPKVLGFLKVTGFSNYLHPYDENHIIGVGREATEEGRQQGVKIALFDVSDVSNPKEIAKYEVKDKYSSSNALYDHKAFLFDKEKNLLVMPMSYREETGEIVNNYPKYKYWQGAFVFNIDINGIELRGRINHNTNPDEPTYYYGQHAIQRSLYMDDNLYTISRGFVKANKLNDLSAISSVDLPYEETYYYDYPGRGLEPGNIIE